MDWVQWMRAQGFPEMFWKSFYKRAGKQNKGRPISKRQIAVAVLEKKMTEPGRAWRELAEEFCDCKKQQHDKRCKENLRQSVNDLKKVLKRYCPELSLPRN